MSLILDGTNGLSDVDGSASTPAIRGTDVNTGIFFPAADTIAFAEGGAEVARFDSNGNALVGSSSSYAGKTQSWGAVTANAATPNFAAIDTTAVASGVGGELAFIGQFQSNEYAYMGSIRGIKENGTSGNTACALTFSTRPNATAPTERMRIDSSGNLLVGNNTASPSVSGNLGFINLASTANTETQITWAKATQVEAHAGFKTSTDSNFYINTGGALGTFGVYLTNTGTSWTSNSDERLKENLVPITDATNKVSQLRAVIGNYISDESKKARPFLIAQDVQAVLPEAVSVNTDELETLGVSYTDVIPLLVASIKELNEKVEAQAVRIAELEGAK